MDKINHISRLPTDIQILITLKLDHLSMIRFFSTCHKFAALQQNPDLWKCHLRTFYPKVQLPLQTTYQLYRYIYHKQFTDKKDNPVIKELTAAASVRFEDYERKVAEQNSLIELYQEQVRKLVEQVQLLRTLRDYEAGKIDLIEDVISRQYRRWMEQQTNELLKSQFKPRYYEAALTKEEIDNMMETRDLEEFKRKFAPLFAVKRTRGPSQLIYEFGTLIGFRCASTHYDPVYNPDYLLFISVSELDDVTSSLTLSWAMYYASPPRCEVFWSFYRISQRLSWKRFDLRKMYHVGIDFPKYRVPSSIPTMHNGNYDSRRYMG